MAKINSKDVEMINHKLLYNLPNSNILDYEMVIFKTGRGRFVPKTELLVVRHIDREFSKIMYSTFRIQRETLCNTIESLIKQ